MKKIISIICLFGLAFFLNACSAGYVAEEPTYVVVERPLPPSPTYIWVNDDWKWNRQKKVYARRQGHWAPPARNRAYAPGYWKKTPRGNIWISGRWR